MNEPKRHHYVPEMLQHGFADGSTLYAFDSRNPEKGVWGSQAGNLLLETHLYSSLGDAGERDATLEKKFAKLEDVAALVIEKIVISARAGKAPGLTIREKLTWDQFLIQQWRRVPDVFDWIMPPDHHVAETERLLDEIHAAGRPVSNYERAMLLDSENLKKARQNLRVSSLGAISPAFSAAVAGRGLAIAIAATNRKSFILGSRPVVKFTSPGVTELSDHRVELWLPVRADVMIGLGHFPGDEKVIPIGGEIVRKMNEAVAAQSAVIVGRSRELISSLSQYVGSARKNSA